VDHTDTQPALTSLAEDEILLRDSVAEFAEAQMRPLAREMDEHARSSRRSCSTLFDLGVMGIEIPEHVGRGRSLSFTRMLAVEALSAVDPSVCVLVDVQNTLVVNAVLRWGTDDVKQRYLPRLAADTVGAYALSEAGSGSDAFALTTKAVADGGAFVLNGRKLWITNGNEADIFIVFANINPEAGYRGITAFMVERGMPGFTVGTKEDKLGIREQPARSSRGLPCSQGRSRRGRYGLGWLSNAQRGIGIGAQMIDLAKGRSRHAVSTKGAQFGKATRSSSGRPAARWPRRSRSRGCSARAAACAMPAALPSRAAKLTHRYRRARHVIRPTSRRLHVKDYLVEKPWRDARSARLRGTSTCSWDDCQQLLG
jgi:hypothetical protein